MNGKSATAKWGRIIGGLLVAALGIAKIIGSMVLGQTSLAMFKTSLAGEPIFFVAMLAFWAFVFASGLGLMKDGISDLRRHSDKWAKVIRAANIKPE